MGKIPRCLQSHLGKTRRLNESFGQFGAGFASGKNCLGVAPISCPEFVSDLMPASPELYSIGVKDRGWINGVFEARDIALDVFSRLTIGTKNPITDMVEPFLEFYSESPIGTKVPKYKIYAPIPGLFWIEGLSADELRTVLLLQGYVGATEAEDVISLGVHFGPAALAVDAGSPWTGTFTRFRDIGHYGWLMLGDIDSRGISLPTPANTYRLMSIGAKGGTGVKDDYKICRKRTAGDYKWLDIFDKFQSISILKESVGITKTDIGTVAVEILGAGNRSKVDLTYFDRVRVVFGGMNNEAVTFYCKIQYSTNQTTWYDLTPEASSDGTINEQLVIGSWDNIPTGALADVFIRAMGRAANLTADPTYKNVELQVK